MVKIPEYTQSVSLRPNNTRGIEVHATAEHFGAAIGRGMQGLAQGMEVAGDAIARVQALEDETSAREARNNFVLAMEGVSYGDAAPASPGGNAGQSTLSVAAGVSSGSGGTEAGYFNTTGTAALKGAEKYKKGLAGLKQKFGAGLTPRAAALYGASVDKIILDARRRAVRHRAAALKRQVRDTALDAAEMFKRQSIQTFQDPQESAKYLAAGVKEIEGLATAEGWSKRKLRQATDEYRSDTLRQTSLHLAQADPVAAAGFVQANARSMLPDQYLATINAIRPGLAQSVARDAVDAAKPSAIGVAATGLPREAVPLLSVIAGTDAPEGAVPRAGSGAIGSVADADPDADEAAATASAPVGRYRVSRDAFNRAARDLNMPAGSGPGQDVAAWHVATQTYRIKTGRDLAADLKAGNLKDVRAGLGETFAGIRNLNDNEFASRLAVATSVMPSARGDMGVSTKDVQFSPRVSALLEALPAHIADGLRETAKAGVEKWHADQAAEFKAHQLAVADNSPDRCSTLGQSERIRNKRCRPHGQIIP